MPSRISMETAMDALYSVVKGHGTVRMTKTDFFEIMRGQGVASSKEAIRTLWARARFSAWNIYTGSRTDMIIVSVPVLADEVLHGGAYTYTHTEDAEGVQE